MGKARQRQKNKDHSNPISKPVKPPADPELARLRETSILPVVKQLQSPEVTQRSSAAIAIANLIEDDKTRKLLLRERVVQILLEQTITDSSLESKSAGWGILRNLALEEEADFSVHLYRQDILTPMSVIIQNILETLTSSTHGVSTLPKNQQALLWTLTSSILSLLSTISTASDEILASITSIPSLLQFLFKLLDSSSSLAPSSLSNETLATLASLTEDNGPLCEQITVHNDGAWLKDLLRLKEQGGAKAVTVCAVLHNIFSALEWYNHSTPVDGASDAALVPVLVQSVEQICGGGLTGDEAGSSPEQILESALETLASIATTLQEALEHESKNEEEFEGFDGEDKAAAKDAEGDETMVDDINEDASDVEGEDEGDDEEGEEDDEMTMSEIEEDMANVLGDDSGSEFGHSDLPQTLSALLEAIPTLLKALHKNNAAALSALNNVAWTISAIDTATIPTLNKIWTPLAVQIWNSAVVPVLSSNTADIDLASSVTSVAWALARSAQEALLPNVGDAYKKFMALHQASKSLQPAEGEDAFQSLGVKSLGVLGRLAAEPAPVELNKEISTFLLSVLSALPGTPVADTVQALDEIFDIYSDDSYECNKVYIENGYNEILDQLQHKVRAAAKTIDKRKDEELRTRADEAVLNLQRFVAYKRREQKATDKKEKRKQKK